MEITFLVDIIFKLIIVLAAARFAGIVTVKLGMPAVVGELLAGIVLGPSLYGIIVPSEELILAFLGQIGIILLLFEVGLESNLKHLLNKASSAVPVGLFGTLLPFLIGTLYLSSSGMSLTATVLIATLLAATSVGISMRVFHDYNNIQGKEAEIVLGAAIIDDLITIVLFSILVHFVSVGTFSLFNSIIKAILAILFLVIVIIVGRKLVPILYQIFDALKIERTYLLSEFLFVLFLAVISELIGLAAIIGAFAAGLVLEHTKSKKKVERRIHPLSRTFVPIFFVMAGANVNVWSLHNFENLRIILFLLVIAVTLKLFSGFFAKGNLKEKVPTETK